MITEIKHLQNKISDILYCEYYENKSIFSSNTSSHWIKYGQLQNVIKEDDNYSVKGVGFGDFLNRGRANMLKEIPTKIYLYYMLSGCKPEIIDDIKWIAKKQNRIFSYDMARMALTLNILFKYIPKLTDKTFCIIGDGYGTLGSLIKRVFPKSKIIFVNLGRTLFFDYYYTNQCFPMHSHSLIRSGQIDIMSDFNYIEAEKYKNVEFNANVFVNIASMQEMNYDSISEYFESIRNQNVETWFYCCNRVEKELPDGTLINFADYGWLEDDEIIFDELCPWHQHFPVNKPPFIINFDGPINHRLIRLKK